jgi:hypothetical protein
MPLTEEQDRVVKEQHHSFRVLAGAGSGKTTTMAFWVKEAIARGVPTSAILFVTFTRFAAGHIRKKVREIIGYYGSMMCGTFHSCMFRMLAMSGHEMPDTDGLFDVRMEQKVEFILNLMRSRDPHIVRVLSQFKVAIVDEFQDVDGTQFEFIQLLKAIQPAVQIIAIGDLAQNIYRFRGTSNEFLRTSLSQLIPDLKTYKLTTNFRSTKSILRLANAMFAEEIQNDHILPMVPEPNAKAGIRPQYYEFAIQPGAGIGEYEELVAEVLFEIIQRAKKESKSFVIIIPALKTQSYNILTAHIRNFSRQNKFAFDFHQIAKEDETCTTIEFAYDPREPDSPIQTSSFHSSKGLEWDIVALVNLDESIYHLREGEEDNEAFYAEKTNLTYVGVTRAMEELYIFANANKGGRHRNLARLGDDITKYVDFTQWGEDPKEFNSTIVKPVGITDILRRLPQHPDLNERVIAVTQHIRAIGFDGEPMMVEDFYTAMKARSREMALGTFVDWKLKQMLCDNEGRSFQEKVLEFAQAGKGYQCLNRNDAMSPTDLLAVKIEIFFRNADIDKNDYIQFCPAIRLLALTRSGRWSMSPATRQLFWDNEKILMSAWKKEEKTLIDEYLVSQAAGFYSANRTLEIQASLAPRTQYQGIPKGFEEFCEANLNRAVAAIGEVVQQVGGSLECLEGDKALETKSLILGEADLYSPTNGGHIIEMKCSVNTRATDLRDVGNCKNLLQVLAYAAMGRHGTIPLEARWATLMNPLTGAFEMYDLSTWSSEQSQEMLKCLEELRMRG